MGLGHLLRRLLIVPLLLLAVSTLLFGTMHLIPGGPEAMLAGGDLDPSVVDELRVHFGLDRPLHVQYLAWLRQVMSGDFGVSFRDGQPVWNHLMARIGPTLQLAGSGLLLAIAVGIPLGTLAARNPYSLAARAVEALSLIGISVPAFWLGIMLILIFSGFLGWLPSSGIAPYGLEADLGLRVKHAILPTITIAAAYAVEIMQYTRAALLEVLAQDYVRTARAKGVSERRALYWHALRNALLPVTTVIGLSVPTLIGGAVLTETVFSWPGLGRLAVEAVFQRDYPIVMATALIVSFVVILCNLATDFAYTIIDPRVRYE
jgi:peptide/nickel transport system permease protein